MASGTGFGKTILIGDQFVLDEVPAIVSAISYETVTTVERIDGEGWVLEDNQGMVAIAFDAGFNSKAAFNTVFRAATGETPSAWREKALTRR